MSDSGLRRGVVGRLRSATRRLLCEVPEFNRRYWEKKFRRRHGRSPRPDSGLLNDYFFYMKTGPELTDPLRQFTTDKVLAKYFIDQVVGWKVTPETYAVFDSVDRIRRADLPDRCVLKPAHASGGFIVFVEGPDHELTAADYETLRSGLAHDMYDHRGEKNYRYLRKRIICEEMIAGREEVTDYKLFCFKGRVKLVSISHHWHSERNVREDHKPQNLYDREWSPLEATQLDRPRGPWEPMPGIFPQMCEVAETIARHFEFVRVDMFIAGDRIYVGEVTHCHLSGLGRFGSLAEERLVSRILFD